MEEALGIRREKSGFNRGNRTLVRYADDFIVACKTEADAKLVVSQLANWLQIRGLSFCSEKTQIVHANQGFYFLCFNVRLYNSGTKQKLLIKPSKSSQVKLRYNLKTICKSLIGKPIAKVLAQINPIIRGWVNYFRIGVSKRIFASMDYYMWFRERSFVLKKNLI
jgi:RNA-directed DNA polymerase